jgi:hypothetical protein
MFQRLSVLLILVALSACSSNQTRTQEPLGFNIKQEPLGFNIKSDIYALLKNTSEGYKFMEFALDKQTANREPWVNLKTGQPLWQTDDKRCKRGWIGPKNAKNCSEVVVEELFFESDFDEGDAAARVLGAAFSMGLTLTGASFDVVFNREKYEEAFKEAAKEVGETTLSQLDASYSMLKEVRRNFALSYEGLSNSNDSKNSIEFVINDLSGLYGGQIDFREQVSISKNRISSLPSFKSKSLSDLNEKIIKVNPKLELEWKQASSTVGLECSYEYAKSFYYELNCPEELKVSNGLIVGTIPVSITAMDVDTLIVNDYEASDENISLVLKGRKLGLENKTGKFISVDNVAFYYGGLIATPNNMKFELAPHSSLLDRNKPDLYSDFSIDWNVLEFKKLTKTLANKDALKFGFAVKYRVVDADDGEDSI